MLMMLAMLAVQAQAQETAEARLERGLELCREEQLDEGIEELSEAIAGFASDERFERQAIALATLSTCQSWTGDREASTRSALQAEALYAKYAPDATFRVNNLLNISKNNDYYYGNQKLVEAGLTLFDLLPTIKGLPLRVQATRAAVWALLFSDRSSEAISVLSEVINHPDFATLPPSEQALVWTDVASMWIDLRELPQALAAGDRALSLLGESPEELQWRADLHQNRAKLYEELGRPTEALNEGLEAVRLTAHTDEGWTALLYMSRLCHRLDRFEASLRWLDRAEQFAMSLLTEQHYGYIDRELALARAAVLADLERWAAVQESLSTLPVEDLDRTDQERVHGLLALSHDGLGNNEAARRSADRALSLLRQRIDLAVAGAPLGQRRELMRNVSTYMNIWLHVHDRPEDNQRALELALSWRAAGQRTELRKRKALRDLQAPELGELAQLRRHFAGMAWRGPGPRAPQTQAMRLARDRLEQELVASVSLAPPTHVPPLPELCAALPDEGALVVLQEWKSRTSDGNAHVVALTLRSDRCDTVYRTDTTVPLGEHEDLFGLVQTFNRKLWKGAYPERSAATGIVLRQALLDPVLADLDGIRNLHLVSSSQLSQLPWAALPDEAGRYLVEDYTLTVLDTVLTRPPGQVPGQGQLIIGAADVGTPSPQPDTLLACADLDLPPLPSVDTELEAVARLTRRAGVTRLQGAQATEASVEQALAARPARVHLASHGFVADRRCYEPSDQGPQVLDSPLVLTGVALAGLGEEATNGYDGIWTGEEVASLDLSGTELVVLSACEVGWGEAVDGGSPQGMRAALAQAGVHQQVLALTPVPDQATAELMEHFYRALGKQDAANALRTAQLKVIAEQRDRYGTTFPGTWGPWTVVGAP